MEVDHNSKSLLDDPLLTDDGEARALEDGRVGGDHALVEALVPRRRRVLDLQLPVVRLLVEDLPRNKRGRWLKLLS